MFPSSLQLLNATPGTRTFPERLTVAGKGGIAAAGFQLLRGEAKMKAEFTYNGETRWQVTPGNFEQVVRELRPRA
jgi:hypothetical protein